MKVTDQSTKPTDRTADNGNTNKLKISGAELDPCSQSFNDAYMEIMKTQIGRFTGEKLTEDLLSAFQERLEHNGYKIEDIAGDPENYQGAISQALAQAKDGRDEQERQKQA